MTGTHHPLLVLQTLAGLPEPSDLRWNRPDAMLEWRGRTAAKRFGWSTWTSSRHAPPVGALYTGRPLARCPQWGGSFSSAPRSEPRGLVSQHEALQRLRREGDRVPVVDSLMAGSADHEGFPAHPGHELCPPGLRPSCPGEVGEFADLVDFHAGRRVAPLAPPCPEPDGQLLAAGGQVGKAVGDDCLLLPFQRNATEPGDQW